MNVIGWLLGLGTLLANIGFPNEACAQTPFIISINDADSLIIDGVRLVRADNGDLVLFTRHHGLPGTFRVGFGFTRLSGEGVLLAHHVITQLDSVLESWLYDAVELNDGTFALAGRYDFDAMMMRLSATGTFMGAWSYPGNSGPVSTATCLETDGDSTLLIGGWAHGSGPAYYDPRVLRVGLNGALLQGEGHSFGAYSAYIQGSTKAQGGGEYFCGGVMDTIPDGYSSDKNMFLFRTDSNGTEAWSRKFLCGGVITAVQRIEQLPSGDLIVGGTHHPALGGVAYPFLMKFNEEGYPLWAKYYALLSGTSFGDATSISGDRIAMTAIDPDFTMTLMVLDTSGTLLSARKVETGEFAQSIAATPDGGLAIGSFDFPYEAGMDLGLVRLDQTMGWMCPATDLSLSADTFSFSIAGTDSVVPVAVTPIEVTNLFADSASFVSTYVPCSTTSVTTEPSDQRSRFPEFAFANEWLTVDGTRVDRVEILDAAGRLFATGVPANTDLQLDMRTSPAGLYLVRLFKGEHCKTGKIMKY